MKPLHTARPDSVISINTDADDTSSSFYPSPSSPTSSNPEDDSRLSLIYMENSEREGSLKQAFGKPNVKWMWTFPLSLEQKWRRFDDYGIELCQRYHGKYLKYFSLAVTALVTIEFGIAVPFVLFFLGYDGAATEMAYLALILAMISQIPKRFIWRLRPYMAGRAIKLKQDETSSFPSRAVTCATVYSFGAIWIYVYWHEDLFGIAVQWWMPILFVGAVLLASFARINLGVHYPSDCIGGLLQGLLVCLLGTGLWKSDIMGCESCRDNGCYANMEATSITYQNAFSRINWWVFVVALVVILGVPAVSVAKPIHFWSKCDRVYGMLLPGIAFQVLFLCPRSTSQKYALQIPPSPTWYSVILGIALAAIATAVGMRSGGKRPLLVYALLFISMSAALILWRLVIAK